MRAAVVTSFGAPPTLGEFPDPKAGAGEIVVDVVAAGLHPRVRSQAAGSHYTSTGVLPLVPGTDAVVRFADGSLHYAVLSGEGVFGSMADRTLVDPRRCVPLPAGADAVAVAAGMNPAMSSWAALRRRTDFHAGQSVLVLGATGNAGRLAVEVARLLGAGRVVAAGRNRAVLATVAADDVVPLDGDLAAAASDVDVVLDYLWGEPAAAAMVSLVTARADRSRPLTWVQIGSVAGATAPIPSAALRASALAVVGSGQGSVTAAGYLAVLPDIAAAIDAGRLRVDARAVPLADVRAAWADTSSTDRIVLIP